MEGVDCAVRAAGRGAGRYSQGCACCNGRSSPNVSMRACEMMAEVRVFQRERAVPADAVAWEMELVLAEKARQGVTLTGKVI